jgi:hypothetical protein
LLTYKIQMDSNKDLFKFILYLKDQYELKKWLKNPFWREANTIILKRVIISFEKVKIFVILNTSDEQLCNN